MSDGWHEVMCDDLEFQASKDKAEERLKISRAMSTQWKRLRDERPQPDQLIWFVDTLSPDVRPRCVSWGDGWTPTPTQFWLPAEPPPAPPCESEAAFEEWWKTRHGCLGSGSLSMHFGLANAAWHAALAWHKNKTEE